MHHLALGETVIVYIYEIIVLIQNSSFKLHPLPDKLLSEM